MFTEKQLLLLHAAIIAFDPKDTKFEWHEIDTLTSDIEDLIQLERERKRERRKSLAIERRARNA